MINTGSEPGSDTEAVTSAVSTLEVRWIRPGRQPARLLEWMGRFPTRTEARDDLYLMHPQMTGVSVKMRGLALLDLKVRLERSGLLTVPTWATAPITSWEKWSFPLESARRSIRDSRDWKRVRKVRHISRFSGRGHPVPPHGPVGERAEGCSVELTDVTVDGQSWWTLAFEASGLSLSSEDALRAAAAAVFAGPIPAGIPLLAEEARTYSQWLQSSSFSTDGPVEPPVQSTP
jgi:hypothetical protein